MQNPPFDHVGCHLVGGPFDGGRYRLADLLAVMDDTGAAWLHHRGAPEAYIEQLDGTWLHLSQFRDLI